jgi:subtilisin family serine protease
MNKKKVVECGTFAAVTGIFLLIGVAMTLTSSAPSSQKETTISEKQSAKQKQIESTTRKDGRDTSDDSRQSVVVATPKQEAVYHSAPKQNEITQKITKEYEYQALVVPNDPYTTSAWSLTSMQLPTAWNTATGNGVVVAVIDSGFGLNHEDLTNQWYVNGGETGMTSAASHCWSGVPADKQANNCDDDSNGYVDDYRGWDFVGVNNSPMAGDTNPTGAGVSHGTQVAGLVGMTGNNAKGSATASWQTKIMPLQALDDAGSGYTSSVVAAVYYAVDNGAKVINMSLGSSANDPALQTAIDYAYQNNVVVVAAAGNCGTGAESGCNSAQPGVMAYPGLNDHVISAGAVTSSSVRASFSSYGDGLDVVAPGSGAIVSTTWSQSNQTSLYSSSLFGTSFASPYVSSVVALIKSVRPSSTVDGITAIIDATATKTASMSGNVFTREYGHGIVNAASALQVASSLNTTSTQTPILSQAGTSQSEHRVDASSALSSACQVTALTYCSVRAYNTSGFDRYLPYSLTAANGQVAWVWNTVSLGGGLWELRAVQGDSRSSTPYVFVVK